MMELNRRLQRVIEVLPSGPASPIWDLDATDSPIASEPCTMSTMSELVSAESNIGCSSPGLPSASLLPDPCLGSIVDLGDGLHGDGGLFDSAQVSCTFSVPNDSAVTSLDSMNTGLDSCDDTCSSDTLKHSVVSYSLSECNTDILGCVKDTCDKTSAGLVFSDQSSLAVGEDFSKIDDLQGANLGLSPDVGTSALQGGSESVQVPADIRLSTTNSPSVTGFNLPVLLAPSAGQPLQSAGVSGALTVVNLNIPLVAGASTQPSNSAGNCAVFRVGQQSLPLTNFVLLPGQTTGAPAASTAFTIPSCNLVTALPCIPQSTTGFTDQYLSHGPGQSSVSVPQHSTSMSFSGGSCKPFPNAVRFPVIINPVTAIRPTGVSTPVSGVLTTSNSAASPVSTQYETSFDSTGSVSDSNMEIDTNRFLNLETECIPEGLPLSMLIDGENSNSATKPLNAVTPGALSDNSEITTSSASAEGTVLQQTNKATDTPSTSSSLDMDSGCEYPQDDSQTDKSDITNVQVSAGGSGSPVTETTNLSITRIVQLFPAKKPPHTYKCDLCSATFNRLGNYSRHRMIHTVHVKDDFRYKCEQCNRMFLQKCDLKRHQLIHTKQEPYKCSVCFKGYIRQSDLKVHMRFHNREKAFKCSYCPKSFYQSGDLNRHVRSVHLQTKMLTCGHCDQPYGYAKEATLIRHMQTKHKDIIRQSLKQKLGASMESEDAGLAADSSEKAESSQTNPSVTSVASTNDGFSPVHCAEGHEEDEVRRRETESDGIENPGGKGSVISQADGRGSGGVEESTSLVENGSNNNIKLLTNTAEGHTDIITNVTTQT